MDGCVGCVHPGLLHRSDCPVRPLGQREAGCPILHIRGDEIHACRLDDGHLDREIPCDYTIPMTERVAPTARARQVDGGHYQRKIQPWDVVDEYGLDYYRGSALKYLLRAGTKEGVTAVTDLEKAAHYIEKAIEVERGNTTWP